MRLLKNPDIEDKEQLAVLKFAKLVASYEPNVGAENFKNYSWLGYFRGITFKSLIVSYLGELDSLLHFSSTQLAVLYIYRTLIAKNNTRSLVPRIEALQTAAFFLISNGTSEFLMFVLLPLKKFFRGAECDRSLSMIAQVVGSIGKSEQYKAKDVVEILIMICKRLSESLPVALKEVEGSIQLFNLLYKSLCLAEVTPDAVHPHLPFIDSLPEARPAVASTCLRIHSIISSDGPICKDKIYSSPNDAITIVTTEVFHKFFTQFFSDIRTTVDVGDSTKNSASELDKNTENLAFLYNITKTRSSLSTNSVPGVNSHGDNMAGAESTSRGSPVSNVSSHIHVSRRSDGPIYIPLPKSPHQPNKSSSNYAPSTNSVNYFANCKGTRVMAHKISRPQPWVPPSTAGTVFETTFPPTCDPPTTKVATGSRSNVEVIEGEGTMLIPSCSGALCSSTSGPIEPEKKDLVSSYVERRQDEIKNYIAEHLKSYPIPVQCTVEGSKGSKSRMRVHFRCQMNGPHCEFNSENLFAFKTRVASIWLHLMFLQMEATSLETTGEVIPQASKAFQTLSKCWSCLSSTLTRGRHFTTLVTSKFPLLKEQQQIYKELQDAHYFDSFTYNPQEQKWCCYSCNHPERVRSLLRPNSPNIPVLEGQLKEKRGRWKFLRRWHTKYFTLSSAALTCRDREISAKDKVLYPSIDLRKVRSVKSLSKGRKSRKSLPKAFEIFTDDHISYILKARDQNQAQEWFQSIQIAVAQAHKEGQPTYAL
ncbi:unnamed protein product [Enterobius vermicularis]|uniref:PH domain-containing protein n=1 Tax=Enterobius vermicularis TaxID=51028 RepID=A0A0N4VP51_ENTVE|nr:unnamed protein product [Enterobius vermicularis]